MKIQQMLQSAIRACLSWGTRRRKATNDMEFLSRWDAACRRSWDMLLNRPATLEKFTRWHRHHSRLLRVAERRFTGNSPMPDLLRDKARLDWLENGFSETINSADDFVDWSSGRITRAKIDAAMGYRRRDQNTVVVHSELKD